MLAPHVIHAYDIYMPQHFIGKPPYAFASGSPANTDTEFYEILLILIV